MLKSNLRTLFEPKSIAILGASSQKGKLGNDVFQNLISLGYQGKIYPINPKGGEILGIPVYKKINEIKVAIDLAIIIVPAEFVIKVLEDCGKKKIKNIIIISAGFKEIGGEGIKKEYQIKKLIIKYKFNLIGPNCLGIINTENQMNASFAEGMPAQGNVSLISQSGAMAVAITDWAYAHNFGFSKIISLGNKSGVDEIELLKFLESDKKTKVILMYLESIENGQKFMEIATRITKKKPVIIIKSGTSPQGTKAISSHTGSLAGSDNAVNAAFKQTGVIRAKSIEEFFDFARAFSLQALPRGNRIAIISNAGGPAIIATDSLAKSKLKLAVFEEKTRKKLQTILPKAANTNNPIDIVGDALSDRYQNALKNVLPDKNVDAVLVILTPQIMTEEEATAELIARYQKKYPKKPIITCFMGGKNIAEGVKILNKAGLPNFDYPSNAINVLDQMSDFYQRKKQKQKNKTSKVRINLKQKINLHTRLKRQQGQISMPLAFDLLKLYKIKTPQAAVTKTAEEAVLEAEKIGYPIVLKICSEEIIHKTEAGGVRVSLKNAKEVKKAFSEILKNVKKYNPKAKIKGMYVQEMTTFGREVIIGMKRDPQFGPMLMFGLGGIYVEVLKDVTFRIAPVSLEGAKQMIDEVKAIELLKGVRGEAPSDLAKLAESICHISQMVLDFPEIQELDLNPLIVMEKGKAAIAIDARILV